MKTRIITGSLIGLAVALFFGLRFINPFIFDALIAILMVCGAGEVSKVFNRSGKYNNMTLATMFPVLLITGLLMCSLFKLNYLYALLIEGSLFVLFVLITLLWTSVDTKSMAEEKTEEQKKSNYVSKKLGYTLITFVYPTLVLSSLYYLNHLSDLGLAKQEDLLIGFMALVMLFVTTMLTDVCAYFVGSLIKGKKLCPYISPNKTISGAIGGIFGAVVGAICTYFVFTSISSLATIVNHSNLELWVVIAYSVVASIISQAGDIFASWLKRRARTKDFSTIFPGHGGFMDRCDGLSFNAVLTLIFFSLMF